MAVTTDSHDYDDVINYGMRRDGAAKLADKIEIRDITRRLLTRAAP